MSNFRILFVFRILWNKKNSFFILLFTLTFEARSNRLTTGLFIHLTIMNNQSQWVYFRRWWSLRWAVIFITVIWNFIQNFGTYSWRKHITVSIQINWTQLSSAQPNAARFSSSQSNSFQLSSSLFLSQKTLCNQSSLLS